MPKERAIILRTTLIRESDLLVSALGEQSGKLQLLARGAKRSKKRFFGGIECFDSGTLDYSIKSGSQTGNLDSLVRGMRWQNLTSSLGAMTCAGFCTEITELLCALDDESCGELFKPLFSTLKAIDRTQELKTQVSVAVYYSLLLLQYSGLDTVEALQHRACIWFIEMQTKGCAIIPDDANSYSQIPLLLQYIEEQVHRRLNSREQFLSFAHELQKTSINN